MLIHMHTVHIYVCLYICVCVYMCTYICICMYAHTYAWQILHVYMIYTYTHVCVHINTHIYIDTYIYYRYFNLLLPATNFNASALKVLNEAAAHTVAADWHSALLKPSVRRKIMCIPIIYISCVKILRMYSVKNSLRVDGNLLFSHPRGSSTAS